MCCVARLVFNKVLKQKQNHNGLCNLCLNLYNIYVLDNNYVLILRLSFYNNFALLTYRKSVDMLALTLALFSTTLKILCIF